MRMLKAQKVEYVKKLKKEIASYKTVAIMPIDQIPDRLLQKVRNKLEPESRFIMARKTLVAKAIGEEHLKNLSKHMDRNFALILSNKEPFELYKIINENKLKLGAKPRQISPADIVIESGDTSIAPGQTVTELKNAGIDVQIQKGKVVIAKQKVLVAKGTKISGAVANALKILEIKPFEVAPKLNVAVSGGLVYTDAALMINEDYVKAQIMSDFREAHVLSVQLGIVTQYNIEILVIRAYKEAMAIGIETKLPVPEIVKILLANAAMQASGLSEQTGAETEAKAETTDNA
jgi:large subunit ribosomal protein L10